MTIQRYGAIEQILDAEITKPTPVKTQNPALKYPQPQHGMANLFLGIGGVFAFFWVTALLSGITAITSQPRTEVNTTCLNCNVEVRQ